MSEYNNEFNSLSNYYRQKKLIETGENITKYPKNPKDIFVYNKRNVTGDIIKKTPNPPQIGSILQLDYNPKIKIYKHLTDNGYNYWYCKYLPNNGRDFKVTY